MQKPLVTISNFMTQCCNFFNLSCSQPTNHAHAKVLSILKLQNRLYFTLIARCIRALLKSTQSYIANIDPLEKEESGNETTNRLTSP